MKKFLLSLMILGLACSNAYAAEKKVCPDPDCDDIVSQYTQNYLDKIKKIWDDALDKSGNINYGPVEECIEAAKKAVNLDETVNKFLSLDFILPDIDKIVRFACNTVIGEIRDQLNKIDSTLARAIPWDGAIDFNDFSKDIADEVLDKVFDKTGDWGNLNNFPKNTTVNDKLNDIANDL